MSGKCLVLDLNGGFKISLKLHVEQNVKPAAVRRILQILETESELDTVSIHNIISDQLWPSLSDIQQRNYLRKNLRVMRILGLIEEEKQGSTIGQRLTKLGNKLKQYSVSRLNLFHEIMHFLHYTHYDLFGGKEGAFSWTYKCGCHILWESRSSDVRNKEIADRIVFEASSAFENASDISLSQYAISGIRNWIEELNPPFIIRNGRSTPTSSGRSFCSPELLLLSIDLEYQRRGIDLGSPLLMTKETIDSICRTCLVDPSNIDNILKLAASITPDVRIQSSQWGRSIFLKKPYRLERFGREIE